MLIKDLPPQPPQKSDGIVMEIVRSHDNPNTTPLPSPPLHRRLSARPAVPRPAFFSPAVPRQAFSSPAVLGPAVPSPAARTCWRLRGTVLGLHLVQQLVQVTVGHGRCPPVNSSRLLGDGAEH
ncbi:hypothetical protein FKM82_025042 [Ascaphus truei]